MQIAIDGPASAGKSTVAKIIANKLAYIYVDTGAMYRACTVIAKQNQLAFSDEAGILAAIDHDGIELKSEAGQQKVYVAGQDVTKEIRTPSISANVSEVSALPGVRKKMVSLQRQMAGSMDIVMDGRDIGTTVLPRAEVKIFLVATARARAERRVLDLKTQGIKSTKTVAEIEADIAARDYKDSHRLVSPLQKATDAIEIDTTDLSIDEVVETILEKITAVQKKLVKKS